MNVLTKKLGVGAMSVGLALTLAASPASAKTKRKASPACVIALDSADRVFDINATFALAVEEYFNAVSTAATTHATDVVGFLNASTDATNALTPKIKQAASDLTIEKGIYRPAASKCRAGK